MDARKLEDFLTWLYAQPYEGHFKRALAKGWSVETGAVLTYANYQRIEQSGIFTQ